MSQLLITGGCGFIGRHLVRRLVADGHRVVVVDDLSSGDADALPPDVELIECDAADVEAYADALATCDSLIHLAAIASVARSLEDPSGTRRVNFGALEVIIQRLAERSAPPRVLFTSSAAVYGDLGNARADPSVECQPITPYGQDKLDAEHSLRAAQRAFGLEACALRLFNVYGPEQDSDSPYAGVVAKFIDAAIRTEPLTVHGDGAQERDFIHVDDVVSVITHLLQAGFDGRPVLNLCSGVSTSVETLALTISTLSTGRVRLLRGPQRDGDVRISRGTPDPSLEAAAPMRELAEGLASMLRRTAA
jgi:UDP-glucose 4-epimerase